MSTIKMKREEIPKEISKLIADVIGINEKEITPESEFENDLGIDLLTIIEISMLIQKKYGIDILDPELVELEVVQNLFNVINEKID